MSYNNRIAIFPVPSPSTVMMSNVSVYNCYQGVGVWASRSHMQLVLCELYRVI